MLRQIICNVENLIKYSILFEKEKSVSKHHVSDKKAF